MADNNLVLTIVIVAAALLLFNGGLSGNAVVSRSCSKIGSSYCIYGDVYKCNEQGQVELLQKCSAVQDCFVLQQGGQTTAPSSAVCLARQSGSTMPEQYSGWRTA